VTRVLISVQNLPVPFDRRVWLECQALVSESYQVAVVCPKGNGDPAQLGGARSSRDWPGAASGAPISASTGT
jgi:hypothetical protein